MTPVTRCKTLALDLLNAVDAGDATAVIGLLARGADVNACAPFDIRERPGDGRLLFGAAYTMLAVGTTPLALAAFRGHAPIVRLLLERGARTDPDRPFVYDALHWAADQGHSEIVDLLVAAGATVDRYRGDDASLILHTTLGMLDLVRVLLRRGADVKAADARGRTALMWAVGYTQWRRLRSCSVSDYLEIISLLLRHGADPDRQNKYGLTALMWVGDCVEALRLLLSAGADLSLRDCHGWTALRWGMLLGNTETAGRLREARASE